MSWVIPGGPCAPSVPLNPLGPCVPFGPIWPWTPWGPVAPVAPVAPVGPGGPCGPILISLLLSLNLTCLQNSTELTKKPSNGPVWHSYFLSSVGYALLKLMMIDYLKK